MKGMILAAGLGTRLRPLANNIPKPLIQVHGKPLIRYHIDKLVQAGVSDIVINVAYLSQQIMTTLGCEAGGAAIHYSQEPENQPLGTVNGVRQALSQKLLPANEPFILLSSDIWTDYDYGQLPILNNKHWAHLVVQANPPHHSQGDFSLHPTSSLLTNDSHHRVTYAGIGVFHPALFCQSDTSIHRFSKLLQQAINAEKLSGEFYSGQCINVNYPAELIAIDPHYKNNT